MSNNNENGSNLFWTVINLTKLCIGSGVLALPYAASIGGLLFAPLGLIIIAVWNGVTSLMMIESRDYCRTHSYPKGVFSTFSKVAYSGCGWIGSIVSDMSLLGCLGGACVSLQISFALMMADVPIFAWDHPTQIIFYTYVSGFLVFPLCCINDVSFLSPISFLALISLIIGLATIVFFGWIEFGDVFHEPSDLPLWPQTFGDMATFLGVSVFCYGLCVMVFPIENSMKARKEFPRAIFMACVIVTLIYVLISEIIGIIYSHDPNGIDQNILVNLPRNSFAALIVRITFANVR